MPALPPDGVPRPCSARRRSCSGWPTAPSSRSTVHRHRGLDGRRAGPPAAAGRPGAGGTARAAGPDGRLRVLCRPVPRDAAGEGPAGHRPAGRADDPAPAGRPPLRHRGAVPPHPELFEIVSFDYWRRNYGHQLPPTQREAMIDYLSTEAGRRHVDALARPPRRPGCGGRGVRDGTARPRGGLLGGGTTSSSRGGTNRDDAVDTSGLASSGTLTPDEHDSYLRFTIDAQRDLYAANRYVRYVAVFQNWLRPAGASFDHLHKQLVAITSAACRPSWRSSGPGQPERLQRVRRRLRGLPQPDGRRERARGRLRRLRAPLPTLEIFSRSERPQPWLHSRAELRGMSDLIHALHAAAGPATPCNEEWHHKPPDADVPMPGGCSSNGGSRPSPGSRAARRST